MLSAYVFIPILFLATFSVVITALISLFNPELFSEIFDYFDEILFFILGENLFFKA